MGGGRVIPLIPRYFDLLVLLVEHRDRAVGKQEIFDRVWADVVVSESALTQAVRVIRRALGDDPREPRFVRTVSRRGYQFVFGPVELEDDTGAWPADADGTTHATAGGDALPGSDGATAEGDPAPDAGDRSSALVPALVRGAAFGALGTAAAGILGGLAGGLAIRLVSRGGTDGQVAVTLALAGALAGVLAGGAVGAGLAGAGVLARVARPWTLVPAGAAAGLAIGWLAHQGARAVLAGLFGRDVPHMGGPIEGLVLGAAAGLGYAAGTATGGRRRAIALTSLTSAIGAVALALGGWHLVGSSLDLMAGTYSGSQVGLEPLARLFGEARLRPVTRMVVSGFEGALFGAGLAFGLTTRSNRR
jgi:DNA-binding winged helix-turn-helix (wHTH) protein